MTDVLGLDAPPSEAGPHESENPEPEGNVQAEPTPDELAQEVQTVEHNTSDAFEQAAQEADAILQKLLADIAPVGETRIARRLMIYGDPGTTKTSFACGQGCDPEFNKGILLADVEKGQTSLANHPECAGVSVLKFKALAQVEALIDYLARGVPQFDHIHTVVLDTYTTLQERDLRSLAQKAASLDSSRNPDLPIGSDYQVNTEHMKTLARKLADLDRNVIIITHVKEEKDDSTGKILIRPQLTAKLAGAMAGMFDMVGYMTRSEQDGQVIRSLQVHPTPNVIAKSRIGGLPAVMVNPKLTDLVKPTR